MPSTELNTGLLARRGQDCSAYCQIGHLNRGPASSRFRNLVAPFVFILFKTKSGFLSSSLIELTKIHLVLLWGVVGSVDTVSPHS